MVPTRRRPRRSKATRRRLRSSKGTRRRCPRNRSRATHRRSKASVLRRADRGASARRKEDRLPVSARRKVDPLLGSDRLLGSARRRVLLGTGRLSKGERLPDMARRRVRRLLGSDPPTHRTGSVRPVGSRKGLLVRLLGLVLPSKPVPLLGSVRRKDSAVRRKDSRPPVRLLGSVLLPGSAPPTGRAPPIPSARRTCRTPPRRAEASIRSAPLRHPASTLPLRRCKRRS